MDVLEDRREVTAKLRVYGYPASTTSLGRLHFLTEGRELPLAEVGPIAWSEGIRMCDYMYASCTKNKN